MKCYVCGSDKCHEVEQLPLLVKHVKCEDCGEYYLEPAFRSLIDVFIRRYGEEERKPFLEEMKRIVKSNRKIYFAGDYNYPLFRNLGDDTIYIEFDDIFSRLGYKIDDLSEGSDYGG